MNHYDISADARRYHYWRGFVSAVLLLSPVLLVLALACEAGINALI